MWCKSGRTYVRHKIFRMDRTNPKLFFQKNCLLSNISKNQVNRRNFLIGKNVLFLKSSNNILQGYQQNHQRNCYKKRYYYEDKKDNAYLLKKLKLFNATWQLWTAHLATKKKYFAWNQKKTNILLWPNFQKYFLRHRNRHHHWEI